MSQTTYQNSGPIYISQSAYNALVTAGTVEIGREYVILDSITPELFKGTTNPTTSTTCNKVGDLYINTTSGVLYKCTTINNSTYTWTALVEDVQVDGTSVASSGVGNIPLASSSVKGVVKGSDTYKFGVSSTGEPNATTMSASDYVSAESNAFMSKGTNENILTAEALRIDGTTQTISSANQDDVLTKLGLVTTIVL